MSLTFVFCCLFRFKPTLLKETMLQKLSLIAVTCAMLGLSACDGDSAATCDHTDKKCEQNSVYVCVGGDWKLGLTCEETKACDPMTFTCENACTTGSRRCGNTAVEVCLGGAWQVEIQCEAKAICNPNSFQCEDSSNPCATGTKRCNGQMIELCFEDAWQVETQCQDGTVCNADTYSCDTATTSCTSGTKRCEGNKLYTCLATGTWDTGTACASGTECVNGANACSNIGDGSCSNGTRKCVGQSHMSCVSGKWITTQCPSACDANKACVECMTDKDCSGTHNICETKTNRCVVCRLGEPECIGKVFRQCYSDQSGYITLDCGEYSEANFCHLQKECVKCLSDRHCNWSETCSANNTCEGGLPASQIDWCSSHKIDATNEIAYGRVSDNRATPNPNTITAKLLCGKFGQKLNEFSETKGSYNPNCTDCDGAFEFQASVSSLNPGALVCVWSFSFDGQAPVACKKNGEIIKQSSYTLVKGESMGFTSTWKQLVDFENFAYSQVYSNKASQTLGKITTSIVGAIRNDERFDIDGKTLVFGDQHDSSVTITQSTSTYIEKLTFDYKGWDTDTFGSDKRKLEIFLDAQTTPIATITLSGKIDEIQSPVIQIQQNVKSFRIVKKLGSTNNKPRILIDNIKW